MMKNIIGGNILATWNLSETKYHLMICNGGSCKKAGAEELTQAIRKEITERKLDSVIHTSRSLCNGRCKDKCVVIQYPEGNWYKNMSSDDAPKLIDSLISGEVMKEKLSHFFNGVNFEATEGTFIGKMKDEETVKKVSKKY